MKLLKAIFFSSLAVIPAYIIVVILSGEIMESFVWLWVLIAYVVGLFVILVIGVPTHLFFKAIKLKGFLPYLFIAFFIPSIFTWWSHPFGEDGFYWIDVLII